VKEDTWVTVSFLEHLDVTLNVQDLVVEGELSREVEDIAARIHYYNDYKQLPVSTGCDSYASWNLDSKILSSDLKQIVLLIV
jgi:hypothetical protein